MRALCASVALVILSASSSAFAEDPPPPAAPVDEEADLARQHHRRGLELYDEGDFRLALVEFERAYSVGHNFKILFNIGQVHFQLNGYAKARLALEQYLKEGGAAVPEARRASVEKDLATLRGRTATLTVRVNVGDADVMINQSLAGKAPLEKLLVDAGTIRMHVTRNGYAPRIREVTLAGGDQQVVTIDLSETQRDVQGGAGVMIHAAFHVERTEDPRLLNVDHVTHAKAIADFRPDVVVVAMGEDFTTFYASLIEKNWPADKPPPYYVVTELNYDLSTFESVLTADSDGEDLRRRISGTRSGSSPPRDANVDDFERRYSTRYGTDASGAWSGYEAMYALIYAIQAASLGGTLDGPRISAGFERLRAGATIDVGPARIGAAFSFLAQPTETINLRGLWSELDWNPVTRDLETDVSMYCFQRQDRKLVIKADAGPRLSGGVFTGTYACD